MAGRGEVEAAAQTGLSDVPLGALVATREHIGSKRFDRSVLSKQRLGQGVDNGREKLQLKKISKHKPREMSAKHPVPRYREVANLSKSCGREQGHDPRFDARSGTLNQDLFVKSYAFVRELCEREKKVIDGEARQTSNPVRKKKLRQLLVAMEARGAGVAERSRAAAAAQEHRCRELEAKRRGQRPFFLKKTLQRRMELMHKYQELRQCGHLHHYLAKKRKRNASRDKTMLPYQKQRTQTFPSQ